MATRTVLKDGPHPVDVHVGAQVRAERKHQGMSQGALAAALGLTFQQVQKYERGANRISASKLVEIADALRVNPADLLPDRHGAPPSAAQGTFDKLAAAPDGFAIARLWPAVPGAIRRDVLALLGHVKAALLDRDLDAEADADDDAPLAPLSEQRGATPIDTGALREAWRVPGDPIA